MNNIIYSITGQSFDGAYGIAAINHSTKQSAVTMQFLKKRSDAIDLVELFNREQVPIARFCELFLEGGLSALSCADPPAF